MTRLAPAWDGVVNFSHVPAPLRFVRRAGDRPTEEAINSAVVPTSHSAFYSTGLSPGVAGRQRLGAGGCYIVDARSDRIATAKFQVDRQG